MIKYVVLGVVCFFALVLGYRCMIVGPSYSPPVAPTVAVPTATPEPFDVFDWDESRWFGYVARCMVADDEFHRMADEMASHPDDSPVHLAFFDGLVLRGDSGLDVCTALRLSAAEALGGSDAG